MIQCEYTRCGKTLTLDDFKSQDNYPCCGMPIQQKIDFPEKDTEELLPVPEPVEEVKEEVVEEKPAKKAPAKKAAAKKKPAKKTKK